MRILFIGDIVGSPGRHLVLQRLPQLLQERQIDFTIANGENVTNGAGLSLNHYQELIACGVDAFTMGNHIWNNKDIFRFIDREERIVRPANFHASLPGRTWQQFTVAGQTVVVFCMTGRVYMAAVDDPFAVADEMLKQFPPEAVVFLDFHAEATSEKIALAWYLDGRVAALAGTHTHVQTNDARVLPRGTGYLTDAGMTGPRDSVLGVDKDIVIQRFRTGLCPRFETAHGDLQFNGVIFEIDDERRCRSVEPVNFWEPAL